MGHRLRGQRIEALLRDPPTGGGHRDPAVALDHLDDTGQLHRRRPVDANRPRLAQRRMADRDMHHVGQADIGGEIGRTVDLGGRIEPGHVRPRQPPRATAAQRQGFGHGLARRRLSQFGKAQPLLAMDDKAVPRLATVPVHAPSARGSLRHQRARGGGGGTRGPLEHPQAAGPGGQHHPVAPQPFPAHPLGQTVERALEQRVDTDRIGIERAERRRLDRDRPPVRAQLVGDHLRQRGGDPLAMLGLRHRDRDDAVAPDLQPRAERLLARPDRQARRIGTRPQAPGDQQPGPHASTDENVAPAELHRGQP